MAVNCVEYLLDPSQGNGESLIIESIKSQGVSCEPWAENILDYVIDISGGSECKLIDFVQSCRQAVTPRWATIKTCPQSDAT